VTETGPSASPILLPRKGILTFRRATSQDHRWIKAKSATAVPAGEQFQASGQVLGVAGRSICLLLQESAPGGSVVQTAKQCRAASGSWQAFGPVTLTNQTAGDKVGYLIRQTGAQAGDSFQADSLSIVDVDTTAPTAPSGLTATVVSGNEVDLSWSAATDADFGGVYGYAVYPRRGLDPAGDHHRIGDRV
jgi:hypothetical protein